ncbi:alpha/beta fold hydrolase [Halomonas sp. AOP42-C2-23]|uniref:alpha/beta fold hydrolase n=1 Tax=Halomonas TaxID=2745 RepID=UPI000BB68CB4|nr:alpha/beta fold hydrolase [Halomonas sp. JB37]PCC21597.1 hypothetical protein CIK78_05660 [Halomonas sp. JB37]
MSSTETQYLSAFIQQLNDSGIQIWHQQGELRFRAPVGALRDEWRETLKRRKQDVLKHLEKVARDQAASWFRAWQPRHEPRQRLICLAHAGGAASFFREWGNMLPQDIEVVSVQYPGREERIEELLIDDLPRLIAQLANALVCMPQWLDRPYALFGHSMGGAVAHELCLALRERGLPLPTHLLVSACEAPSRRKDERFHLVSDAALQDEISRLGGASADFVSSSELIELVLPVIRSDYQLIETYRPDPDRIPLDMPITALTGDDYGELDPADARAWCEETTHAFQHLEFTGGHFYLIGQRRAVLSEIDGLIRSTHDAGNSTA